MATKAYRYCEQKQLYKSVLKWSLLLELWLAYSSVIAAPIVIAHRGASGYLPEHTLASLVLAHSWNVDYIEADLVMTQDDRLLVVHDIHLDSVTDVKEKFPDRKRVDGRWYAMDFTGSEIASLQAHERTQEDGRAAVYPQRFPLGQGAFQLLTFDSFVETIRGLNHTRQQSVGIYVELKSPKFHTDAGKDIVAAFYRELERLQLLDGKMNVIIQCFDGRALRRLREEFQVQLPLIQLVADNSWQESDLDYSMMLTQAGLREVKTYAEGIGPWIPQLIQINPTTGSVIPNQVVQWAHDVGLLVHPYTIRKEDLPPVLPDLNDLHHLLFRTLGVDGAFSDFGDLTLAYLRSGKSS